MKLVFLDKATLSLTGDIPLDRFQAFGEVTLYDRTRPEEVADRIGDAELAFTNKVVLTNADLDRCPNLRYIGVLATGTNVIESMDYATKKGIVVTNVPGYSTDAVAQFTLAHILMFACRIREHDARVKQGEWQNCPDFSFYGDGIFELAGKTLGVIGYGAIAKKVIRIAQAFGMQIVVHTRTPHPEDATDRLRFVPFDQLLQQADIITIHCPLTPQTNRLFDTGALEKMKPGAYLINTARGPVVDERALADALNSGRLGGYGADVVSKEPIAADNPLLSAKSCNLTPHIAWAGYETRVRLVDIICENVQAFLAGKPQNQVNR